MATKGSTLEFNIYSILAHLILTFIFGPLRGIWLTITARSSPHIPSSTKLKVPRPSAAVPFDPKLGTDCPYEYILRVYGRNHFSGIVNILNPNLAKSDPVKFQTVMDIMDVTHFAAILVDDVVDNSPLRKGKPAAHTLWGSAETINRAYFRLFEVLARTQRTRPELVPIFLENLAEIHEGQDISLVWRRDGAKAMPKTKNECVKAYRHGASLKTGALFRLVGQLVTEDKSKDELMSRVGWYCHLQNDCKNVYSADYVSAKGALAEDVRNGEYSYPVILALFSKQGEAIRKAFAAKGKVGRSLMERAMKALQQEEVQSVCLNELKAVADTIPEFVKLWGRREKMNGQGTMK